MNMVFRDNIVWRNMAFSQTNTRPVKLLSPPKTLVVIKKTPGEVAQAINTT